MLAFAGIEFVGGIQTTMQSWNYDGREIRVYPETLHPVQIPDITSIP